MPFALLEGWSKVIIDLSASCHQTPFQVTPRDISTKFVIHKHATLMSKLVVQGHVESRRETPSKGSDLDLGPIVDFLGKLTDFQGPDNMHGPVN
jgi:hypothetical protein